MGQLMSIVGLLYVKDCNLSEVIDCLSLFPPYPQYYKVDTSKDGYIGKYGMDTTEKAIPKTIMIHYVTVNEKCSVCLFHYRIPDSNRVLIFSHGNATDNGCYVEFMQTLGNALRVNVICYDYEGYGCSDGQAKNGHFFRDLMNVYIFSRQFYDGKNIFFFGDSIGCVPTCQVGAALWKEYRTNSSHENARPIPIGGLILQSALYSGSSALIGGCLIRRKDPYNNGAEVSHISCPIFHIHGMKDEVVPFSMGKKLYSASKSAYPPWWIEDGQHCNLYEKNKDLYIQKIQQFLDYCASHV